MLPGSQHFKGKGVCWSFGLGIRTSDKRVNYSHGLAHQTTSWLVHNWSTFGAQTSHKHTWTHKTHHGSDLRKPSPSPL